MESDSIDAQVAYCFIPLTQPSIGGRFGLARRVRAWMRV